MAVFLPKPNTHTKGGSINRRWDLGQDVPTEGLSGQSAALTPTPPPVGCFGSFQISCHVTEMQTRPDTTWKEVLRNFLLRRHFFFPLIKRMEVSQELVVFPTFTLCLLAVSECVRLSCCCPSRTGFRGQAAAWRIGSARFLLPPKTPSALSGCHTQTCRTLVTDWVVTEGYICFI